MNWNAFFTVTLGGAGLLLAVVLLAMLMGFIADRFGDGWAFGTVMGAMILAAGIIAGLQ